MTLLGITIGCFLVLFFGSRIYSLLFASFMILCLLYLVVEILRAVAGIMI